MLKPSLDNKVTTKTIEEEMDILTQDVEVLLMLEGTMFRIIEITSKMLIQTTMLH